VRPATPARIALTTTGNAFSAADLRLRTGDERRQAIHAATVRDDRLRLRLRLILRLRAMLAIATIPVPVPVSAVFAIFPRLLVIALIGLRLLALIVAHVGLLLLRGLRREARLLAEMRKAVGIVIAVFAGRDFDRTVGAHLLRLVLTELLLRRSDQAEIMLGVLVVVLGGDRIARGARIARELDVFLGDVGGGAADLDVGPVGFVDPGHRVLAAPVVIMIVAIVVPVTHPLVVVLTVSHVLPLFQP
jgi:hypothetical protein